MRLAGFGLILAAVCVALAEWWQSGGVRLPADTFSAVTVAYEIAATMAVGGFALLLLGGGRHPVEEEPENSLLRLVG
jgi:hypothetical protein